MTYEEIKKALEAASTQEEKIKIVKEYGSTLSQDELSELCNKPVTKEQMEMIAAGSAAEAFFTCAWN